LRSLNPIRNHAGQVLDALLSTLGDLLKVDTGGSELRKVIDPTLALNPVRALELVEFPGGISHFGGGFNRFEVDRGEPTTRFSALDQTHGGHRVESLTATLITSSGSLGQFRSREFITSKIQTQVTPSAPSVERIL
jgi:hypothetical protein